MEFHGLFSLKPTRVTYSAALCITATHDDAHGYVLLSTKAI